MSHTSTISRVRIMDIDHLTAAINELRADGVPVSIEQGGTPRAYYKDQAGLGPAAHTIRIGGGCKYDIGVYPAADGRGFEMRTDLWAGEVARVVGVDPSQFLTNEMSPSECAAISGQASMGRVYQRYAVVASEREAARQGHTVTREQDAQGGVTLTIGLAA